MAERKIIIPLKPLGIQNENDPEKLEKVEIPAKRAALFVTGQFNLKKAVEDAGRPSRK